MKQLLDYILEYKQRVKNSFDYDAIRSAIENCKPTFFGKCVDMTLLWTPQIYFDYNNGWAAGKPADDKFKKKYNKITLGTSGICFISFYAEKKLFKKNEFFGRLDFWYSTADYSDEEKKNIEEVIKYVKSKFNAEVPVQHEWGAQSYFKFTTYEELEEFLKGLEEAINKFNTNYDKNNAAYIYFDKNEAEQNSADKKKQYEIVTAQEEIVKLNKELEDIKKAATASDTDLTPLMDMTKKKIDFFKNQIKELEK